MSKNYSLYELLNKNKENLINFGGEVDVNTIVKLLAENNFCQLPFKVGDIVYKLCEKKQLDLCGGIVDATVCEGCFSFPCLSGFISGEEDLAVMPILSYIPFKVNDINFTAVLDYWNILYFATEEEASDGKQDLYVALEGKTAKERFENYVNWLDNRKLKMSEITRLSTPDDEFENYLHKDFSDVCYAVDNDESFNQNFKFILQCEKAGTNVLEALVYKHIPSGRYLCLDRKEPNISGRVCEVEVITSISYTSPEELGPESTRKVMRMAFEPYFCGGHIVLDDNDKAMVWFKERTLIGGEQND